jgi:hypothetical protein
VDTHLLPRTVNGIPEALPAPLDRQELWGDAPQGAGGAAQRPDSLDAHQRRYSQTGVLLGGGQWAEGEAEEEGGFRPLGQPAAATAGGRAAARYQQAGEEGEGAQQQQRQQQRQSPPRGKPALSISTRRPPGSPVILRGDHLPSPTRPGAKAGSNNKKQAAVRPRMGQR